MEIGRSLVSKCQLEVRNSTGSAFQTHRSAKAFKDLLNCQVMLYLLLMEERYGTRIERGLLQYLNTLPPEVSQQLNLEMAHTDIKSCLEVSPNAGSMLLCILMWQPVVVLPIGHIISMGAGDQNDTFRGVSPDHAAQHAGLSPLKLATAATYDRERDGLQVLFPSDCMHALPQGQPPILLSDLGSALTQNPTASGSYIAQDQSRAVCKYVP